MAFSSDKSFPYRKRGLPPRRYFRARARSLCVFVTHKFLQGVRDFLQTLFYMRYDVFVIVL